MSLLRLTASSSISLSVITFRIHVALVTDCVVLDLLAVRLIRVHVAFATDCFVLDHVVDQLSRILVSLGTDCDRVCHLVLLTCDVLGILHLLLLYPVLLPLFLDCATVFSSCFFSFLLRLLSSQRFFFALFQICISGFSFFFDLFYDLLVFFERAFFFSDFFVRLFPVVLLCCSELVFVCFMGAIFFWVYWSRMLPWYTCGHRPCGSCRWLQRLCYISSVFPWLKSGRFASLKRSVNRLFSKRLFVFRVECYEILLPSTIASSNLLFCFLHSESADQHWYA